MNKIIGYHYTNSENYKSMQINRGDKSTTSELDDFKGLIPIRRFISLRNGNELPKEAYAGVIEGLLEPKPKSWIKNPEFPNLWDYLMHDICRREKIILLSFELTPKDKAYVVDRAHVERELYRESKGQGESILETKNEAFKKYWESRVPVFEYDGSYSVPQLSIWSGIKFNRLKIEWEKSCDEVWERVLNNN